MSTIPASPAIAARAQQSEDNKENEVSDIGGKSPARPRLGSRKSTRSVLIEQRILEFQLVNKMLHQAMEVEGVDDAEAEKLEKKASDKIDKVRSDLTRIRQFEKENGRTPNEAELADMASAPEEEGDLTAASLSVVADVDAAQKTRELEDELSQSQLQVASLQNQLEEINAKMDELTDTHSKAIEEAVKEQGSKLEKQSVHSSTRYGCFESVPKR